MIIVHTLCCIAHFDQILIRGLAAGRRNTVVPGLLGGTQQNTSKGNQMEERMRAVLLLLSMRTLTLANGVMSPALERITMFVKEVSE